MDVVNLEIECLSTIFHMNLWRLKIEKDRPYEMIAKTTETIEHMI